MHTLHSCSFYLHNIKGLFIKGITETFAWEEKFCILPFEFVSKCRRLDAYLNWNKQCWVHVCSEVYVMYGVLICIHSPHINVTDE